MHTRKTAKASATVMKPKELWQRRLSDTECSLRAHQFRSDRCLEQCRLLECHHPPQVSDHPMVTMAVYRHQCRPGLPQPRLHPWLHHPAACPSVHPPPLRGTAVRHRAICLRVSKTLHSSINQALLPDLDLQSGPRFLHQHFSMVSGGSLSLGP